MARREIVWSKNAEGHLKDVLDFYTQRNKNPTYSRTLYRLFKKELRTVLKKPEIGKKTKIDSIRGLIVKDYIIFYEIFEVSIVVLKVWDCRQNPKKLIIP